MRSITKLTSVGIPAIVGISVAWLAARIIRNEQKLEARKLELEVQLNAKSLLSKL